MNCDPTLPAFRRLACAILVRAVRDAAGNDPVRAAPARRWLVSAGVVLAGELEIDPDQVTGWVDGLEPLRQLALPL